MNLPYGTVYELCDYQFYQIHVPVYIYRFIKEAVYRVCLVFKLNFFFICDEDRKTIYVYWTIWNKKCDKHTPKIPY